MQKKALGCAALLLCAFFWGTAFSAQSNAMRFIEPYTFVFLRSLITAGILLAALTPLDRLSGAPGPGKAGLSRHLAVGGLCGTVLVAATILQQIGLVTTTPAKSGFITALYILIVPMLGVFLGRRPRPILWLAALLSLLGLYFLCMEGGFRLAVGDLFTLGSAFVFAVHILAVDRWGRELNSVALSAIQFTTAALWAGILCFALEKPSLAAIGQCWKDIAFVAVFSGALGYTLQIFGQKYTDPTLAALLMCLESVFAALGGWVLLGDALSARELLGCALMLSASVAAQLPDRAGSGRAA